MLDTETTGLDPARHRIVELSAIVIDAAGLRVAEHHWSPEQGYPALAAIAEALESAILAGIVVVHNVGFDLAFLRACAQTRGGALAHPPRWICTMRMAGGRVALGGLAAALGTPVIAPHTARGDANTLALVLLELLHRADKRVLDTVAGLVVACPAIAQRSEDSPDGEVEWPGVRARLDFVVPLRLVSLEQRECFRELCAALPEPHAGPRDPAAVNEMVKTMRDAGMTALALDVLLTEARLDSRRREISADGS